MKKYYLFVIKNDYYRIYRKNPYILYKILERLYMLEKYDFSYGISLYKQLCQPFGVKLLKNYIMNKYKYNALNENIIKIKSLIERTFLQIWYPTTIIFTDVDYPEIFKIFNIYNRKIFVCEFNTNKYFWLNQKIIKNSKK